MALSLVGTGWVPCSSETPKATATKPASKISLVEYLEKLATREKFTLLVNESLVGTVDPALPKAKGGALIQELESKHALLIDVYKYSEGRPVWSVYSDTSKPPAKDVVRFYKRNRNFTLRVSDASSYAVYEALRRRLAADHYRLEYIDTFGARVKNLDITTGDYQKIPLALEKAVPGLKHKPGASAAKNVGSAEKATIASFEKAPVVESIWNLAFNGFGGAHAGDYRAPVSTSPTPVIPATPTPQSAKAESAPADSAGEAEDKAKGGLNPERVCHILNRIFAEGDEKPLVYPLRGALFFRGSPTKIGKAMNLMMRTLDAPFPRVRMTFWVIQVNTNASDFNGTAEKLETIDEGLRLVSGMAQQINSELSQAVRSSGQAEGAGGLKYSLERVGFDPSPDRLMTLSELILLAALANREELGKHIYGCNEGLQNKAIGMLVNLDENLAKIEEVGVGDRPERARLLRRLVERLRLQAQTRFLTRLRSAYIEQSGNQASDLKVIGDFADAWHRAMTHPSPGAAHKLRDAAQHCDIAIQVAFGAVSDDLDELLYDPYIDWVREICSETNELNVVGKQQVAVTSGTASKMTSKAVNYHPFVLRDPSQNEVAEFIKGGANELAALDILLKPPPAPTYTTVAPGLDIDFRASVFPGSSEARLNTTVKQHIEAEVDADAQAKGLAPVSYLNELTFNNDVAIKAYSIFELSTLNLQTTRKGPPTWSIPILRDIPLVGRLLFSGPPRPRTFQQGVVILASTGVVPRCFDFIPQDVFPIGDVRTP